MRISDGALRRFWKNGRAKGIDPRSAEHIKELLSALNAATRPEDMAQPGIHLQAIEEDSLQLRSEEVSDWCSSGKTANLFA